jgi:hypothetical protein
MDKEMIRDYELDIIVKAWRDERFRKSLLRNPKKAIEDEFNITIPDDMQISIHEEGEHSLHLIVPSRSSNFDAGELSDDELKDVVATNHLAEPRSKEENRLRNLQHENDRLRKTIEKLNNDLSALEAKVPKP